MKKPNKWERLFLQYIDYVDCTLYKIGDSLYGLEDNMGTNYANMNNEQYSNVYEVVEKLSYFEDDYIISDLCNDLYYANVHYSHDFAKPQQILKCRKFLPHKSWNFDIVDMLYNHLDDINLNKLVA